MYLNLKQGRKRQKRNAASFLQFSILMRFEVKENNRVKSHGISPNRIQTILLTPKGQLISKCLLGDIVSTKKPTNFFKDFCPSL